MPTKEELEAELNASEKDKAIAKLRELIADIDEWEADLQALEREVWQPHWSCTAILLPIVYGVLDLRVTKSAKWSGA